MSWLRKWLSNDLPPKVRWVTAYRDGFVQGNFEDLPEAWRPWPLGSAFGKAIRCNVNGAWRTFVISQLDSSTGWEAVYLPTWERDHRV